MIDLPDLPIKRVLAELVSALSVNNELVLEAPPGAGKTTLVPLALLDQPWLVDKKILVLQPRRMAARATATRMAALLGEEVGLRVGYRVRLESRISKKTKIEVVTEGILTRMLLDDPALETVGLVIFDEFHERHLESDVGLAFCLQGRTLFREESSPLKILLMSATLDGARLAQFLDNAPLLSSDGKMFPVSVVYGVKPGVRQSIIDPVVRAVLTALTEQRGSILVFLPGQGEIHRVKSQLESRLASAIKNTTEIIPLYGALALNEQQRAIEACAKGRRKVVLSTDIAETSLTIEGITVVVDSGLKRQVEFDPNNGMSRLHTRSISEASSVQRMGRAGRLSEGVCYRLWSESQQQGLAPFDSPEILQADLCSLVLQLLSWGVSNPDELEWLDSPPKGPFDQALDLLFCLGAIEKRGQQGEPVLTDHGKAMTVLPLHPRLAHMLLCAQENGLENDGALLAALLAERDPFRQLGVDLALRMQTLQGKLRCEAGHKPWLSRVQQQASHYRKKLKDQPFSSESDMQPSDALGFLVACAFPDRIAKRRSSSSGVRQTSSWQLSGGSGVELSSEDSLSQEEWLVVAETGGNTSNSGQNKIYLAASLNPSLFSSVLLDRVQVDDVVDWNNRTERFVAEKQSRVGQIVLHRAALDQVPNEEKCAALIKLIRKRGLDCLPWTTELHQWRARVNLVFTYQQSNAQWPELSDQALLSSLETWLAPYLDSINSLKGLTKLNMASILKDQLTWPMSQQLENLAPCFYKVPSGSNIRIDYTQSPPVLAVKLQEMFGCVETPSILNGKLKLVLHLLSPAQRPLQVTQDLAGFWQNSYTEIKKDMKGRYPRHPWPEDPIKELPTRYTKRREQRDK